jgi:hypothetical protein
MKNKTSKNKKHIKLVYNKEHYSGNDGMLTTVWGPSLWHYLHTMSFNYPINPTKEQKKYYKEFILNLKHVLPCKYCRINLVNNFKTNPLRSKHLKNRETFSKYIYDLHEIINSMLGKTSNLTYEQVRDRYEHFRARCSNIPKEKIWNFNKNKTKKKEKGCTEPLYGEKSKCIIKIVPQKEKCNTFQMDKKCIKSFKEPKSKK